MPRPGSWDDAFGGIAVVVIGGASRVEHLEAAYDSWTSIFKRRLFVTDMAPEKHAVSAGLKALLHNVYEGHTTERSVMQAYAHKDHPIFGYIDNPEAREQHWTKEELANMSTVTRELYSHSHTV